MLTLKEGGGRRGLQDEEKLEHVCAQEKWKGVHDGREQE